MRSYLWCGINSQKKNERKERIRALIVEFSGSVDYRGEDVYGPQRTRKDIAICLGRRKSFSCGLSDLQACSFSMM